MSLLLKLIREGRLELISIPLNSGHFSTKKRICSFVFIEQNMRPLKCIDLSVRFDELDKCIYCVYTQETQQPV